MGNTQKQRNKNKADTSVTVGNMILLKGHTIKGSA